MTLIACTLALLHAASRAYLSFATVIAREDAPEGIASARAVGMRVLTVAGGHLASTSGLTPRTATPAPAPTGNDDTTAAARTPKPRRDDRPSPPHEAPDRCCYYQAA
ncbi:hypothetical protein [Nocardiopsis synnemataformans]|uniref:hypothetical protein n=1 Tax=Nocardiopsis synnemataformans TaxID=61305 RepID=UPI003EBD63B5